MDMEASRLSLSRGEAVRGLRGFRLPADMSPPASALRQPQQCGVGNLRQPCHAKLQPPIHGLLPRSVAVADKVGRLPRTFGDPPNS